LINRSGTYEPLRNGADVVDQQQQGGCAPAPLKGDLQSCGRRFQ